MRLGTVCALLAGLAVFGACREPQKEPPAPGFDGARFARGERTAPDLSALPDRNPAGSPWVVEPLFPDLTFGEVVWAGTRPGTARPLYVLEHVGRLWEVRGAGKRARKRRVHDLTDRAVHAHEAGANGFAFHPNFGRTGASGHNAVFVSYVAGGDDALLDRLSRFRWRENRIDPSSEEILVEQRHRWQSEGAWGEHFGGTIAFGPDGFLYLGIGDEGGRYRTENPQRLDRNLFSGLFRIDVDADPARSHPAPRQPANGRTGGYGIPRDNPFVGRADTLEEFWALGLRNPWGFSFDTETGDLWIPDVGNLGAEEINAGVAGGNYQWSYREGDVVQADARPAPPLGTEQTPRYTYPHGSGDTSIIGGGVYRAKREPSLRGRYVFGDHGSGRIRTLLQTTEAALPVVEDVATVPPNHLLALAAMGDGEILVLGRPPIGVSRLKKAPPPTAGGLPERLSDTGLFADVATLRPAPGVLPYDVNVPSFRHGADSSRWIALPGDGSGHGRLVWKERILFRRDEPWTLPRGSVLALHTDGPPSETHLLVIARDGAPYGATYRATADGSDATRVDTAGCTSCHNAGTGYALGTNTRQLAGRPLPFAPEPQLEAWAAANLFSTRPSRLVNVPAEDLQATPLRGVRAPGATLERRARSYLEVNCAPCHRGSTASFSTEITTSTASLLGRTVRNPLGADRTRVIEPGAPERSVLWLRLRATEPGLAMPPLRTKHDGEGVAVVREWIQSLDVLTHER